MRCGKYVSRACTLDLAPVQIRDGVGVLLSRASLEVVSKPGRSTGMVWRGEFCFGETWAAYRGPTAENTLHAHAAFQIVVGHGKEPAVVTCGGDETSGRAILIRPMVPHSVSAAGDLSLMYVEPQSPMASALLELVGPGDIALLPHETAELIDLSGPTEQWFSKLEQLVPVSTAALDSRLAMALVELARDPGAITIAGAARLCGLSESRLRTLARDRLGLPLSTWLIWRKLERAAQALAAGASLAEAALAGGFSDQAHFARSMRRMFGVTPGMATDALK